ncbi:AT-hook motif nuclear-localized protein 29-like [Vicia villosa]|uniref:AT-hook motif nuclear-localized protein 29-like n=1 Tax=Vicia villosa TaxID=3911 RepID=UPI00273C508E|nr:AT-hook motif nuclear-localized protein 29-like [Vicia villosa]
MAPQMQIQTPNTNNTTENNNHTSSSVVGPRPRWRPLGSKNKSKVPVTNTSGNPDGHVFEISAGADVSKSIFNYVCRRRRRINIISGNGEVAQATLRQSTGKVVTLCGRFQIIAICGTIFPSHAPRMECGLEVLLSGTEGQVARGNVIPPLVAFNSVFLVGTPIAKIVFENVSLEAYNQNKQKEVSCDANGHVAKGGGGLLNGEGSTT